MNIFHLLLCICYLVEDNTVNANDKACSSRSETEAGGYFKLEVENVTFGCIKRIKVNKGFRVRMFIMSSKNTFGIEVVESSERTKSPGQHAFNHDLEVFESKENEIEVRIDHKSAPLDIQWWRVCGGTLDRNSGKLIGPDHASGYPENQTCTWNITVLNGYMLSLTLNVDGYNDGNNCSLDHIKVMEVLSEETISRWLICSGILALKSNRSMRIVFHSDNDSTTGLSFNASWVSKCGEHFSSDNGELASPDNPVNFDSEVECNWTIIVSPGHTIVINYTLPKTSKDEAACKSYVQVTEGDSDESTILCKSSKFAAYKSSSNTLRISFMYEPGMNYASFYATWHSDDAQRHKDKISTTEVGRGEGRNGPTKASGSGRSTKVPLVTLQQKDRKVDKTSLTVPECSSRSETEAGGYFKLAGENGHFGCIKRIKVNKGFKVRMFLMSSKNTFGIEVVESSERTKSPGQHAFNHDLEMFESKENEIEVRIDHKSASLDIQWWRVCGGTLDRNSGKLIGPDHASGYPENQTCTWDITVLNGYMLSLTLNVDGYNDGTNCSLDHIEVMEVQSEETISRWLICSGILTLKSNKSMRIVFHSDNDSTTGLSFNVSWVSICGGTLHGNSGKLIGPDHASGYLESQICIWNITVQNGYMMSLTLNVDGYNDCSLDHIQVVEVQSEKTINRGLICSGMLTLKSNKSMGIVFHSDNDSTTGLSFNASWVSISTTEVGRGEGRNGPNKAEDISGSTTAAVAAPMALVIFILICLLLVQRAKSIRCFSKEQAAYNTKENMYDSVNDIKMDNSKLEISKNILQKKSFNPQTFRRRLPTTPTGRLSAILAQVRQRIRFGNDIYDTAYDEPEERWHTEFRESKQENAHSEQEKISITNKSTRETFINPDYISADNVDQVKTRSVCSNKSVDKDCVVNESTVETIDNDGYLTPVDFNNSLTGIHTSIADSDSMKLHVAIHHKEDKELNTPLCIGQDSVAYIGMEDFIETTNTSVCIKLDDGAQGKDLYGDKDETHGKQAAIKETRTDETTDSYLTLPTYPGL